MSGAPRQDCLDERLALARKRARGHPVTDDGQLVVPQAAGGDAADLALLGEEHAGPVVADRDASRHEALLAVRLERGRVGRVPAKIGKLQATSSGVSEREGRGRLEAAESKARKRLDREPRGPESGKHGHVPNLLSLAVGPPSVEERRDGVNRPGIRRRRGALARRSVG